MSLEALLRSVQPGERPSAEQWNIIIELLKRRVVGPNVVENRDGWFIKKQPIPDNKPHKQFQVVAFGTPGERMYGDFIWCRGFDGTVLEDELTRVLLPHELRVSRYHNKFEILDGERVDYVAGSSPLERIASITEDEYEELQVITPRYVIDGFGGTIGSTVVKADKYENVEGGLGQAANTPDEDLIQYMIVDARAWAEKFSLLPSNQITQRSKLRGLHFKEMPSRIQL